MAYRIELTCVGCRVCAQKCPTRAITGEARHLHVIDPVLCIDCGVCASFCPVDECIFDDCGVAAPKIKPVGRPIAVVYPDLCSGCGDCIDICSSGCLVMTSGFNGDFFSVAWMADLKACSACRECERVCSDKGAIRLEWPDGRYCASLGEVPGHWVATRKAGALATR